MKKRYYPREALPAVCVVCLRTFTAVSSNTIYCSNACCQEAYRERKRQREQLAGDQAGDQAGDEKGNTRHEASS